VTDWPFGLLRRAHYGVILCDFPWRFESYSGGVIPQRAEEQHYPTMSIEDGKALPVGELAAPDCALIMWSFSAHTRQTFELAESWGFEFKSKAFTWAKLNKLEHELDRDIPTADDRRWKMTLGHGTRKGTEDAWLFTRGTPMRMDKGVRELIVAPIREHSQKPDEQYERLERLYDGPYCELFSRTHRRRWAAFGNDTGRF